MTLMKVFENWSHLSACGALSDAIKSLDKYARHKNEVVLIFFLSCIREKKNTFGGFREAFFWAFSG